MIDPDYASDRQVAMRRAPGAACCQDEDCELSGGYAHVGPCEICNCGKKHAIAECPHITETERKSLPFW